jgi:zinc protease
MVYAGGERVDAAHAGLADLAATLVGEATEKHDALALTDALDNIGAILQAGAGADAAAVSLSTLTQKLDPALDLFAEVITEPRFDEKDLERVRDLRLGALLQQKDSPPTVASLTASRVVYGDVHPYAYSSLGTEATLKALGKKDVVDFYKTWWRPQNAELIVVGDTTLDEITRKLEARLAGWAPMKVAKAVAPGAPPSAKERKVYVVDVPQASQSVIGLAQPGVSRANPDYVPLLVANEILGGSFSSRINMNLRERNGYSYGARSRFDFLRGPGLFFAGGSVRANVTREALVELMKELAGFRSTRVTAEELAETRSSLIGKLPARFETNGAIVRVLAELERNGLQLNWYASFAKKVQAVTAADVQRVAQKYLLPDRAQVIVVGDRQSIEDKVKELTLGAIELRGRAGEPL